jgi:hypothetical protein
MPEKLRKMEYCPACSILCPYANLEKEVINCISDDEPCNKWRILVKDVNNNLKEKYKINLIGRLYGNSNGK